jgi:hypothetical protein
MSIGALIRKRHTVLCKYVQCKYEPGSGGVFHFEQRVRTKLNVLHASCALPSIGPKLNNVVAASRGGSLRPFRGDLEISRMEAPTSWSCCNNMVGHNGCRVLGCADQPACLTKEQTTKLYL